MDSHITPPEPALKESPDEKIGKIITRIRPSFLRIWSVRRRYLSINASVALLAIVLLLLFVRPYYESTMTILPEYGSKSQLSGLSDLASLAGLNLGESSPMEIYRNLLSSEAVVEPVVCEKYKTQEHADSVNLLQYFDVEPDVSGPGIDPRRAAFVKFYKIFLNRYIKIDMDQLTKIMTIKVRMPERQLSVDVANRLANSLDNYIRTKRKSFASNQRFYLEKRCTQVADSLAYAEENLRDFKDNNKVITQSAELLMQEGRLVRNVEILNTIFMEITKQLELAKLDEIRDTPVLNIKEYARDPIEKAGPNRRLRFVFVVFLSLALTTGYYALAPDMKGFYNRLLHHWHTLVDHQISG